jgi:hypothetical protein
VIYEPMGVPVVFFAVLVLVVRLLGLVLEALGRPGGSEGRFTALVVALVVADHPSVRCPQVAHPHRNATHRLGVVKPRPFAPPGSHLGAGRCNT